MEPAACSCSGHYFCIHTTACALERHLSKWDLAFAKNRARLSVERASQIILFLENHVCTEFSEADLLDLSLEDDK